MYTILPCVPLRLVTLWVMLACVSDFPLQAQQLRLELSKEMLSAPKDSGSVENLIDEQRVIIGPPVGVPLNGWEIPSQDWNRFPYEVVLDLGKEKPLSSLWLFDTNGEGQVVIRTGSPNEWTERAKYDCKAYQNWAEIPLDINTRFLQITRMTPEANFAEIALYEHSTEAWKALEEKKLQATRAAAEKQHLLLMAREEALKRPTVEMEPYGKLSLVDEVDTSDVNSRYQFSESPIGVSKIEMLLDRPARLVPSQPEEASYLSWRIGKNKLLRPGAAYVLTVDYPEDISRSMIVINTGNETSRGLQTGLAVGDALHSKYVNSLPESLDIPLSKKWETWSLLFRLHDRFPERGLVRGPVPRPLAPEDGFDVTIAQFSSKNDPMSAGIAVGKIRLYEVIDESLQRQSINYPPDHLPRRQLFWREEMADGVIDRKNPQPGITNPIDWYRYKAELLRFLGMNTYSKDLLEFGACQHWDSTEQGGNDWVYFDNSTKGLWNEIVTMMGEYNMDVLPYYEYAGSRGSKGLGNQRRAKPLTRDDAYSNISWIEDSNADITDPETLADFQKMINITVVSLQSKAHFKGIWLRPRGQLPISFSEAALKRFAESNNKGIAVTRSELKSDSQLYDKYISWWHLKRRDFLTSMRDYLRTSGIKDASVLFTGCAAEPGVSFPSWNSYIVTDRSDLWEKIVRRPDQAINGKAPIQPISIMDVVRQNLYRNGLKSPALNWGDWEIQHAHPADDPQNYSTTEGVLLTHAFNRSYTVADPSTMQDFRGPTGLAMLRHYSLNENMMFDKTDGEKLGYFVSDIERSGPYCMMAEAQAIANGDPTMIGYLVGANFGRGFPLYVRNFNANFLALPALPSTIDSKASDDIEVIVRRISTASDGTWLAVVNNSRNSKSIKIDCKSSQVVDAVSGESQQVVDGKIQLELYPFQLRSFRLP